MSSLYFLICYWGPIYYSMAVYLGKEIVLLGYNVETAKIFLSFTVTREDSVV